jgi:EpsD family peptidyl-prolyl cis-trans isomerase
MKRQYLFAAAAFASLSVLAGCSSDAEPTGQVVATVDGVEITQTDLNAELGGAKGRNATEQQALQRGALQNIINRTLLAQAAAAQDLDKSPDGAMMKRRAEQMAMIALLEKNITAKTPQVSSEEATEFVSENPTLFDQRRIFLVEQIAVNANTPKLLKDLEPLNTMPEVQAYLTSMKLNSQMSFGVIDALQTDPAITRQILALAPDAVFVLPQGDSIRINRIRDSQIVPVSGTDALAIAKEILVNQRRQQQLLNAVNGILEQGKGKVQYSAAFKPVAQPANKQAAPAASAGAAADE